jgi:hypothetical protein
MPQFELDLVTQTGLCKDLCTLERTDGVKFERLVRVDQRRGEICRSHEAGNIVTDVPELRIRVRY